MVAKLTSSSMDTKQIVINNIIYIDKITEQRYNSVEKSKEV